MKPNNEDKNLFNFHKILIDALPCGILIVNSDRRVYAINDAFKRTFGLSGTGNLITHKLPGEILNCINVHKSKDGCGFSEECRTCQIRNTALKAIAGNQIYRNKANARLLVDGKIREFILLVSSAPFERQGERLAIIMVEDITELNYLRQRLKTEQSFRGIISADLKMQEVFETIKDVADVNVPVLIQGKSGTGKELVASAIHNGGPRANRLFVAVNCAALPEGLLESELFGHVKGAFTGAIRDKKGRFELADGGTLFLDEVGDLPKMAQAKLLRVLQEGSFEPVGSEKTLSVDVRIISATNQDLKQKVKSNNFREDLYYRLNVVPINLPLLKDRKNDIPLLSDYFLSRKSKESGVRGISKEAMAFMLDYSWPGNVRELHSVIQYALIKCRGQLIRPEHLPAELTKIQFSQSGKGHSRQLNKENVRAALVKAGGNKAKAARLLRVGRTTLYRFLAHFPDVS